MEFFTKTVEVQYVKTEFGDIPVYEVQEILEALEQTSVCQVIVIHNTALKNWLEKEQVLFVSGRGSCYRDKNLVEFAKQFDLTIEED